MRELVANHSKATMSDVITNTPTYTILDHHHPFQGWVCNILAKTGKDKCIEMYRNIWKRIEMYRNVWKCIEMYRNV